MGVAIGVTVGMDLGASIGETAGTAFGIAFGAGWGVVFVVLLGSACTVAVYPVTGDAELARTLTKPLVNVVMTIEIAVAD